MRETVLVVGHLKERLVSELEFRPPARTSLIWVEQPEPLGIAHALGCAAEHVTRPFLCLLGDVWFEAADLEAIAAGLEGADAVLGVRAESDPGALSRNFAVNQDREGWVHAVEEKPRASAAGSRGIGIYAFRPEFMACASATPPSALRGERELTDAIQRSLEGGARVRAVACAGRDFNLSEPADLLAANLHALTASGLESWIEAEAEVEVGASVRRSVVLAGARIARGAELEHSLVFPGERVPPGSYRSVVCAEGEIVACPPRA